MAANSKELLQMYKLNGFAQPPALNYSLLLGSHISAFKDGIKFVFSSKIEIIDGGEGFNSSHGCSPHNMFPFFAFCAYTFE
jgi:hypothetical protein